MKNEKRKLQKQITPTTKLVICYKFHESSLKVCVINCPHTHAHFEPWINVAVHATETFSN